MNMNKRLLRILQTTPLVWAILFVEIVIASLTYAILSTNGISKSTSFWVSFSTVTVLTLFGLLIIPQSSFRLSEHTYIGSYFEKILNKRKKSSNQTGDAIIRKALDKGYLEDIKVSDQKSAFRKMQAYLSVISSIFVLLWLVIYIIGLFLFHDSLLLLSASSIVVFLPLLYILRYYFDLKNLKDEFVQKQENEETRLKVKRQQLEIEEKELELREKRIETTLEMVARIESIKEKNIGEEDIIEELQSFALRLINDK